MSGTQLLWLPPEDRPPGHLALRDNGVCIHESHRTVAHKEAIVNKHTCEHLHHLHWLSPQGSVQREQTKYLSPSLSLERI